MLNPKNDYVVILPEAKEDTTKSGIIIPQTTEKEVPSRGCVLSVGPFVSEICPGDDVIFRKYAGDEIESDGSKLVVVREEDVLAIVEPDPSGMDQLTGAEEGEI